MTRNLPPAAVAALLAIASTGGASAQTMPDGQPAAGADSAPPSAGVLAPKGADPATAAEALDVEQLRRIVIKQGVQLDSQARALESQAELLQSYRQALELHQTKLESMELQITRGAGAASGQKGPAPSTSQAPSGPADGGKGPGPQQPAAEAAPADAATRPEDVQERPPEVTVIRERGGVLTNEGTLILEPEFEYSNSSENRFFFQGVEIVETVLIGLIEATSAQRDSFTGALSARYGVTDRFEVGTRIPYVVRDDRVTNQVVQAADSVGLEQRLSANDLGDMEVSAHYQINDGRDGWPFFIANARFKTDTGKGPFDVERDSTGIETELPTGSGFMGVESSVTVLYPTDPAVLFANLGYFVSFPKDIDKLVGNSFIGTVEPGHSLSTSFGIGVGLNEMVSISFGYEHSWVKGTTTEIDGISAESDDLQVGSLLFGISAAVSDSVGVNMNVAAGLTEAAPDVRVTVRVPVSFDIFGPDG